MKRLNTCLIGLIAVGAVLVAHVAEAAGDRPVVLELFTSQGCSSCPPADRILGKLADDKGVIALSFHVDYWDYIGWKDTFASKVTTARQHRYAQAMTQRHVYTPQLVVDGKRHMVGSDETAIRQAMAQARHAPGNGSGIHITDDGSALKLSVSAGQEIPCEAWLFAFDRKHEVAVERGENNGQKLVYTNVVRDTVLLGRWAGGDRVFDVKHDDISMQKRDGYVIIVQSRGQGEVMAATQHRLK
jgi:hypothetical protein